MYRVYDKERHKWIKNNIYLSSNGDLYRIKNTFFGNKLVLLSDERYIWHKSINVFDKNQEEIYEGDYVEAEVDENKIVSGMICYAYEYASYIILCYDTNEYYYLGSELSEHIKIIGNVFDGRFRGD